MIGGWALRTLLTPPGDVLEAPAYTLVTARDGTVGHSLRLNTSVTWSAETVVANQATGTVTTVALDNGSEVRPGQAVYTVDLRPVVVAAGKVPMFRDLRAGDRGADVRQLQELLEATGYAVGELDGRFGVSLDSAVRAWQRDIGVGADGVVRRGDVVFVPALPARLALDPEIVVGRQLSGGEVAVRVLPDDPVFTIALPDNQARLVLVGMPVEILRDDRDPWRAEISELRQEPEGAAILAVLVAAGSDQICRDECGEIPLVGETLLSSLVHVVPEESGVTIPAAALVTTAAGQTAVVLPSGELRPVEVLASATGMAVVDGIEVGEQVRTPGELPDGVGADGR